MGQQAVKNSFHLMADEKMKKADKKIKMVLIVDDEEDMIWSLKKNLPNDSLQIDTLTASSGEEALETLSKTPVDLVVTDIKMPGMSGLELLTEIKNHYPHIGVIVMTAYPSQERETETLSQGGLSYIEKPFDISEMRKLINHALKDNENGLVAGTISGRQLSEIIRCNCHSNTTSALTIKSSSGEGVVYVVEGKIIHAACDNLEGEEAFYKILKFKVGEIDSAKIIAMPKKTITRDSEELINEGMSKLRGGKKEIKRDIKDLDTLEIEIPRAEKRENKTSSNGKPKNVQTVLSDEGIIEDSVVDTLLGHNKENNPKKNRPEKKNITEEEKMAELKELLTEFTNVPGVSTVCLVGRDGFLLHSVARTGVEAEMIGAIAASGFGTSESMGDQLGKGNLAMTMIEYDDGPVMLSPIGTEAFLVVVADKESNLGMIRLKIKKHTPQIYEAAAI